MQRAERLYGISELAAALGCCYAATYERIQEAEADHAAGHPTHWYLVPAWVKPKGPRREVFFSAAQIQAAAQITPAGPPPFSE